MNTKNTIELLIQSNTLKRLQRSGWVTAGVQDKSFETVAAHSWGTCLVSLLLAKQLEDEGYAVNLGIVLELAILHDLPEIVLTDIPHSAIETVGQDLHHAKKLAEMKAVESIFSTLEETGTKLIESWKRLSDSKSIESQIVVGADIIDMLVHAISLERNGVSSLILDSFFSKSYEKIASLEIKMIRDMYNILKDEHSQNLHREKARP